MSSADKWLVKRRHYGGGDSVVIFNQSEAEARRIAGEKNEEYQTDNYYAEKFDLQKLNWPDADHLIDSMD